MINDSPESLQWTIDHLVTGIRDTVIDAPLIEDMAGSRSFRE